ncbi:hypothetical protein COU59_00490 [Candidatus Pacearchaeota archaeon CG10_big_fil_rev_8_21_14_0_10_34_12]|nr:MAG: hypothetical protein COU59_00490 [Candidatus Pacearchaeota archaeon CG10_big_fil_rev_8_21_14_0_10_34_12]
MKNSYFSKLTDKVRTAYERLVENIATTRRVLTIEKVVSGFFFEIPEEAIAPREDILKTHYDGR